MQISAVRFRSFLKRVIHGCCSIFKGRKYRAVSQETSCENKTSNAGNSVISASQIVRPESVEIESRKVHVYVKSLGGKIEKYELSADDKIAKLFGLMAQNSSSITVGNITRFITSSSKMVTINDRIGRFVKENQEELTLHAFMPYLRCTGPCTYADMWVEKKAEARGSNHTSPDYISVCDVIFSEKVKKHFPLYAVLEPKHNYLTRLDPGG